MKEKLTGWYPPDIAPVREGVYQVKTDGCFGWYRWIDADGTQYAGDSLPRAAAVFLHSGGIFPLPWRGLAEEPK